MFVLTKILFYFTAPESKRPEFLTVLPSRYSVKEGEGVTLKCHVVGRPAPYVTWFHESVVVLDCDRYSVDYRGDCATLTLRGCTSDMGGEYTCLSANRAGEMRCITKVSVISEYLKDIQNTICMIFYSTICFFAHTLSVLGLISM